MQLKLPIIVSVTLLGLTQIGVNANQQNKKYTPDWPSIDSRPLPSWYDEAKIGIFMHFGVYSVPGFKSEWFWINWHNQRPDIVEFMQKNYPPNFTYQDFGPQLTMEFFNASWFADVIAAAGAKYLVFTSKHHEGFTNWPSSYTYGWNSMDIGPKRDVIGELKEALNTRQPDVKFGIYYSLFEWFHPLYLRDKANNFTTREFVLNKMMPEMKELVEKYEPYVFWSDGDWEAYPEYFGSEDFLAWLYNESPAKDYIVTNDRWGMGTGMAHGGYWSGPDRWSPGALVPHKWENAMTVDSDSWGIRRNIEINEILTPDDILTLIVSTVSCGGNILVNVGPTKEGTIIPIFEERLRQMGTWLKTNGEAIYSTIPWKHQNDSLSQDHPVWYTAGKGDLANNVYALVIGWPEGDALTLGSAKAVSGKTRITMLGMDDNPLDFNQTDKGLEIKFPSLSKVISQCGAGCQWVYGLRLENVISSQLIEYDFDVDIVIN